MSVKLLLIILILASSAVSAGSNSHGKLLYKESFEDTSSKTVWQVGKGEKGGESKGRVTSKKSRLGRKSFAWYYSFKNLEPAGCIYVRCGRKIKLAGKPQRISVWVYGDGSGRPFTLRLRDSDDKTWQRSLGNIDWDGWRRLEIKLIFSNGHSWGGKPDSPCDFVYPVYFNEFIIGHDQKACSGLPEEGTIFLDDFRVYSTLWEKVVF